jgi:pilus assembly protein CpaC
MCWRVLPTVVAAAVASLLGTAEAAPPPGAPGPLPEATRNRINTHIGEIREAEGEITVPLQHSKLIRTRHEILRASIAEPGIVEFVPYETRELELIGKSIGSTTITLWLNTPNGEELLTFSARVEDRVQIERRYQYGVLEDQINEMFPDSRVSLFPVSNKLIVKGQARDAEEASHIMAIIRKEGGLFGNQGLGANGSATAAGTAAAVDPVLRSTNEPPTIIVNLLRVPGDQQVMLKVKIAEMKRSTARDLSVDFDLDFGDFVAASGFGSAANMFLNGTFDADSFNLFLQFLERNNAAKVLAQPNLVTISGQSASFVAGGQFAVPTIVGVDGVGAATTQFKNHGTQLTFTPTVLDKDRIRLQVQPEFSNINQATTVNGIFGLDTRSVTTTVDLREGQVLAIAGLILDQQAGSRSKVPVAGDAPIAGTLFNSKNTTRDETELVILVSPELVHPMEQDAVPMLLPGDDYTEPNDIDFYLRSQIEGRPHEQHRSTVWSKYRHMLLNPKLYYPTMQQSQNYYVAGPHGLSD